MDALIKAVQDWPVILQGAIGSAVFWLVLIVGQKLFALVSNQVNKQSLQLKKTMLQDRLLRLHAVNTSDYVEGAPYASLLVFRASRPLLKALMWIAMGLMFGPVLGIVGVLGGMVYLFMAYSIVGPMPHIDDINAEITKTKKEFDEVAKALKK